MANERLTETLVRDKLRALGYSEPDNGISVEEQKSEIAKVKTLLAKASKNLKGNAGYPEFIISNRKDTAFLIVIECKPSVKKHQSAGRDKPIDYAVDGVLHYASHLSKHYTVLAVGIAIVPMSSAISPNPVREELMKYHTLDAVMSMPAELFYPVGTVTCIMVWIAGKPHAETAKKTWFGYQCLNYSVYTWAQTLSLLG